MKLKNGQKVKLYSYKFTQPEVLGTGIYKGLEQEWTALHHDLVLEWVHVFDYKGKRLTSKDCTWEGRNEQ